MLAVRVIRWIAGVAGLAALTLGLVIWFTQIEVIPIHMILGLIVALSFLILGIMGVSTKGMRLLGAISIVYALFVPVFGLLQLTLLVGSLHWLVQLIHLLLGLGALTMIGVLSARYLQLKQGSMQKKEVKNVQETTYTADSM